MEIKITSSYITLGQLLKYFSFISSGADAKEYLLSQTVLVNGENENRRGRKLYVGDVIKVEDKDIYVH